MNKKDFIGEVKNILETLGKTLEIISFNEEFFCFCNENERKEITIRICYRLIGDITNVKICRIEKTIGYDEEFDFHNILKELEDYVRKN